MIGYWNYRRCKQKEVDDFDIETTKYFIAEVYYDNENNIVGWSEEGILKEIYSEEVLDDEFKEIKKAFKKPILDLDNIEIYPAIDKEEEFYSYNEN
jgi:hypothetical protein